MAELNIIVPKTYLHLATINPFSAQLDGNTAYGVRKRLIHLSKLIDLDQVI